MRKMVKGNTTINVVEHIILRNMWEYYITDHDTGRSDVREAFVMGEECELGDVYLPEIQPYILSRTKNLKEVAPASGWKWQNESED